MLVICLVMRRTIKDDYTLFEYLLEVIS